MLSSRKELYEKAREMYRALLNRTAKRYETNEQYVISDVISYECTQIEEIFRPMWGIAPFIGDKTLSVRYKGRELPAEKYITEIMLDGTDRNSPKCFDRNVSDDGTCKVVCRMPESIMRSVKVIDGELVITSADSRKWYEHIGISFGKANITVFFPQSEYSSLSVKGSTGNAVIPTGLSFANAEISLSTGNVTLCASVSEKLKTDTDTGDINISGITAGEAELYVFTGETKIADASFRNMLSEGSTGNITLKNVTVA